jgi:hypothetical protein
MPVNESENEALIEDGFELNLMKHWLKTKLKMTSMVRIWCTIQED